MYVIIAIVVVVVIMLMILAGRKEGFQCVPNATWHTLDSPLGGMTWDYPQVFVRATPRCIAQIADKQMRDGWVVRA